MKPLTIETIRAETQLDKLSSIKEFSGRQYELNDIAMVALLPNIEVLIFRQNFIKSIWSLRYCTKLMELDVGQNRIASIDEFDVLYKLPIRILTVVDNPFIADNPDYRLRLIGNLPLLRLLDNIEVTKDERERARKVVASLKAIQTAKAKQELEELQEQQRRKEEIQAKFVASIDKFVATQQREIEAKNALRQKFRAKAPEITLRFKKAEQLKKELLNKGLATIGPYNSLRSAVGRIQDVHSRHSAYAFETIVANIRKLRTKDLLIAINEIADLLEQRILPDY